MTSQVVVQIPVEAPIHAVIDFKGQVIGGFSAKFRILYCCNSSVNAEFSKACSKITKRLWYSFPLPILNSRQDSKLSKIELSGIPIGLVVGSKFVKETEEIEVKSYYSMFDAGHVHLKCIWHDKF